MKKIFIYSIIVAALYFLAFMLGFSNFKTEYDYIKDVDVVLNLYQYVPPMSILFFISAILFLVYFIFSYLDMNQKKCWCAKRNNALLISSIITLIGFMLPFCAEIFEGGFEFPTVSYFLLVIYLALNILQISIIVINCSVGKETKEKKIKDKAEDSLKKLKQLKEEGTITEEEYKELSLEFIKKMIK